MKPPKAHQLWPFLVVLIFACNSKAPIPQDHLKLGTAKASITPAIGSFIAGDKLNRRFTGIQDSLYVKAAVFHDGEEAIALLTLDCIGLMYPDVNRIRKAATALVDFLPELNIVISSNHIHNGPDVVGIWGPSQTESGVDSLYMEKLIQTAAQQILLASQRLQKVSIQYVEGTFGNEWVHNISEPDEIDRSVTVLQFLNEEGNSVLTLSNFACHPTFFDAVHDVVSADYIGRFSKEMENTLPGEHFFLQGAIGGWVQPDKGDQSFELGYSRGEELANYVQQLLKNPVKMNSYALDLAYKIIDIPISNPGWQQLAQLGIIQRDITATTTSEITWFQIGSAQFITHPGETPPAYSLASKALMESKPKFVLGLSQDALGYILKPNYFGDDPPPHAEYLKSMSPGPEVGPLLMETIEELIPTEKNQQ